MDYIIGIAGMGRLSGNLDKDQDLVRLGSAIRTRRRRLALSQEALADLAEIDRSHMGKIERGERNVTFLNIVRIAKAMECLPSMLLVEVSL